VVRLERNYRSTPAILSVANAVIAKNAQRHAKVLRPRDGIEHGMLPEVFVFENENEESENVAGEINHLIRDGMPKKQIAVLYRSNGQGAMLEAELRRHQIPYLMSGGTAFFDRKETRDILAYLRCAFRPNEIALRRIINTPPRGVGEKTIEALTNFSSERQISFNQAAMRWREAGVEDRAGASLEELFQKLREVVPFLIDTTPKDGLVQTPGARMIRFFEEIGYKAYLEKLAGNQLVATKRWRVVEIFSGILDRFVEKGGRTAQVIKEFLDAMELRDALNDQKEDEDRVQLMTLHACKGLEFPHVFMLGLEEDIIPHKMLGSDVAEERRLFYVGVTRAKNRLILTRAKQRRKYGKMIPSAPSRFLLEIPKDLVTEHTGPRPVREENRRAMVADLFAKLDALGAKAVVAKV
jgi:DNA helicase-2/ATP-dependent DNA helicase PcrA